MENARHLVPGVDYPRTFQEMDNWFRCKPKALTPFFWLVTNHIARNHIRIAAPPAPYHTIVGPYPDVLG